LAHTAVTTEQRNPASARLDEMPVESILRLMNREDRRVPEAVAEALPQVAEAVEVLMEAWRGGGRWIYVGAGTSGRIAALDAVECPPTFGAPPERVLAVVAGGQAATDRDVEGTEDNREAAVRDLEAVGLRRSDAVVGVAASGRTPYVVAAVRHASKVGCATVGISNNAGAQLSRVADVGIEVITGPEVLTGSTRLKAGTSQKLVLNMLSTATFTKLGKVYENLMVDVQINNEKLRRRARGIIREATGMSDDKAEELLRVAGCSVKVAVLMAKAEVSAEEARKLLNASDGNVRRALDATQSTRPT